MAKKSKQKDESSTNNVKDNTEPSKQKDSKINSKRTYIIWGILGIIVIIAILILALTGKSNTKTPDEINEEIINEEIIPPTLERYDLSAYANNLNQYVGTQTTLAGFLKWEQVETETNSIANNYRLVDSFNNEIPLGFAGLNNDFSKFEPYFIKGEVSTQAYEVKGKFDKTFSNVRFQVESITPK